MKVAAAAATVSPQRLTSAIDSGTSSSGRRLKITANNLNADILCVYHNLSSTSDILGGDFVLKCVLVEIQSCLWCHLQRADDSDVMLLCSLRERHSWKIEQRRATREESGGQEVRM